LSGPLRLYCGVAVRCGGSDAGEVGREAGRGRGREVGRWHVAKAKHLNYVCEEKTN